MSELVRFGVSVEKNLVENFDKLIESKKYVNRSEALRDLMRDALVKSTVENQPDTKEVLGSLTLIYDHHVRDLTEHMTALQHDHPGLVTSVLHIHISHSDCMEVIVLRGKSREVRDLANGLLSLKGVKHGELFLTVIPQRAYSRRKRGRSHGHR